MNIDSAKLVFFSPTKTTVRIVEAIAQGVQVGVVGRIDLTPADTAAAEYDEIRSGLAIVGAPVYGGRIPTEAMRRLRQIRANGTPAVVVAVYGNREYEDALRELRDVIVELGFRPIAGGAFIGEHSYSSEVTPIAAGRPDRRDLEEAMHFGRLIKERMATLRAADDLAPVEVPGGFPYIEKYRSHVASDVSPVTAQASCNLCGVCSTVCPTGAITVKETVLTERDACILCSACVKECPTGARSWQAELVERAAKWLNANCGQRKEPEFYL